MLTSLLNASHTEEVLAVMRSRTSFLNIEGGTLALQKIHAEKNLLTVLDPCFEGFGSAFGVWNDIGVMQAVLFTLFSSQQPCYFINKAYTRPEAPLDTLPAGLSQVMKTHEEWGYRRFYALYSKNTLETYKRLWRKTALLQNYHCYTEYESAPNERPKFQEFWELLYGRLLYNEPMIVRAFVQNEHARNPKADEPESSMVEGSLVTTPP